MASGFSSVCAQPWKKMLVGRRICERLSLTNNLPPPVSIENALKHQLLAKTSLFAGFSVRETS
jgi:hypothetical protein